MTKNEFIQQAVLALVTGNQNPTQLDRLWAKAAELAAAAPPAIWAIPTPAKQPPLTQAQAPAPAKAPVTVVPAKSKK